RAPKKPAGWFVYGLPGRNKGYFGKKLGVFGKKNSKNLVFGFGVGGRVFFERVSTFFIEKISCFFLPAGCFLPRKSGWKTPATTQIYVLWKG
ncbi:hypothetical protein, partial [Neisseria meningitidis]|uniref:hypothetical protein n=1 Tax=Neisseria meningitidis TaxID=487 RepID=UPI001C98F9F8